MSSSDPFTDSTMENLLLWVKKFFYRFYIYSNLAATRRAPHIQTAGKTRFTDFCTYSNLVVSTLWTDTTGKIYFTDFVHI